MASEVHKSEADDTGIDVSITILVLKAGLAETNDPETLPEPFELPVTTASKRPPKQTDGPLSGRWRGTKKDRQNAGGTKSKKTLNSDVASLSFKRAYNDETALAPTRGPKKKIKMEPLQPYIIAIDLGMWGSARASAPQGADPNKVNSNQNWPGAKGNEYKCPSMVAFIEDNPGRSEFRHNRELVAFKVKPNMKSHSFFKAALDHDSKDTSHFDNPIVFEDIARSIVNFSETEKAEKASLALLRWLRTKEEENVKALLREDYKNTPIIYVLTHPAACSNQGREKLEDLAHEAGFGARKGDKVKLLSEALAGTMAAFASHTDQMRVEAWRNDFKKGDWITTIDIGSLTIDLSTVKVEANDPVLQLSEATISTGGRCGIVTLQLGILKAILRKFGISESDISPELVGRGSDFLADCESTLMNVDDFIDDESYTFRLAATANTNLHDHDEDAEEFKLMGHEMELLFNEYLQYPKKLLSDQISKADAKGHDVKTVVLCGGGSLIEVLYEKLKVICHRNQPRIEVIRPRVPIAAVCTGAVISQLKPDLLSIRMLPAGYGILVEQVDGSTQMQWLINSGDTIDARKAQTLKTVPGHLALDLRSMLDDGRKFAINVYMYVGGATGPKDPNHNSVSIASMILLTSANFSERLKATLDQDLPVPNGTVDNCHQKLDVTVKLGVDDSGRLSFGAFYGRFQLGKGDLRFDATVTPTYM